MSSETPNNDALTIVAPGVRFSVFEIFLTPAFCFASDLSVFTSSFVHSRRTVFFVLAKATSLHSLFVVAFYHARGVMQGRSTEFQDDPGPQFPAHLSEPPADEARARHLMRNGAIESVKLSRRLKWRSSPIATALALPAFFATPFAGEAYIEE